VIDARQAEARRQADELAAGKSRVEQLQAEWQERHATLDQELATTRAASVDAAKQEAEAILQRARAAADREQDRVTRMLAHVEQAQAERLAAAVAETSRDAVARLLATLDAPDLEQGLVGAACREVASLGPGPVGSVLVESAKPLSDGDRGRVVAACGSSAGDTQFRVVPALGAGLRVTTGRGLIDASAAGIAAEAGRRLKEQLSLETAGGGAT